MSEPVPSDDNLRRVREKVIQLAREIEQMSGDDIPPQVFFQEFVNRVVMAIGARAGVVWLMDESGRLGLAAQVNLEETGLREKPGAMQVNEKLLVEVMQTGEARTLTPDGATELPTEHVLVLSAVHKEKDCVGVVELFQRTDVPLKAQSGYMQFLEQMCGYASRYVEGKRRNQPESADLKSQFWTDFEQFSLRIQRSLKEQEVADASAGDTRSLLGVDRVSIVVRKGRSVRVRSVSGQTTVNHRANLITAMTMLARRVIEMGETLIYTGKVDGLPPQIEEPLAAFIQESGSRMVMLVPTFENEKLVRKQGEEEERQHRAKRRKATGCLVIEQVAETEPVPQLEQRSELLADHIGAALWNARQYHRIFGLSLWSLIGKSLEWFRGRKLAITTAVVTALVAIGAALALIKVDFPVDAEGKLMPVDQYTVFAKWDGEITGPGLKVSGGERVEKGDILVVLENDELEEEIKQASAEIAKQQRLLAVKQESIRQEEAAPSDNATEKRRNISRLRIEKSRIDSDLDIAELQRGTLVKRRDDKLTIRAPAAGIIPNFQLRQLLVDRPVRQGDHLFDIMDDKGKWHMELLIAEKRMGHILRAQEDLKTAESTGKFIELPGEFTLATQPDSEFDCHLTRIATRSTTESELGTAFELVVVADPNQQLPKKRIGAEVNVRIYCGESTLFYRWFGDVVEFMQKFFWL
jgi:hypothetical protein